MSSKNNNTYDDHKTTADKAETTLNGSGSSSTSTSTSTSTKK